MCGERAKRVLDAARAAGSSPRVRGTRRPWLIRRTLCRFIPACAGNAWSEQRHRPGGPVHPRVCGERSAPSFRRFDGAVHPRVCGERREGDNRNHHAHGSSPRVRGTQQRREAKAAGARFIPACAGNAAFMPGRMSKVQVHPRVCGERQSYGRVKPRACGSSPRVRGTPFLSFHFIGQIRFIPACAGNAF